MRKYLLAFVIFSLLINCDRKKETVSIQNLTLVKANINDFLDNWHNAASEANYENYFSKMDSVSIFIGTDASENWNKLQFEKFSKPHFDKGKAWNFKAFERNVYVNNTGRFVWFDELLDTWMGTCRGSGVLEKIKNEWKIKHYVLSISIPNNDVHSVIAAKKKNDSLFVRQYK